jgi:hypothetical protein
VVVAGLLHITVERLFAHPDLAERSHAGYVQFSCLHGPANGRDRNLKNIAHFL